VINIYSQYSTNLINLIKMSSQKTVPNGVKFLIGGTSGFVFFLLLSGHV